MKKRVVFGAIIGLLWILFFAYLGWKAISTDRAAPQLTVDGPLEISVAEMKNDRSILLQGVHASDDTDGDLTAHILTEKITKPEEYAANEFLVSYIVFDKAGNARQAERKLIISDYEKAVFCCNTSLRFEKGTAVKLHEIFSLVDVYDGTIKKDIVYDIPTEVLIGDADYGLYEGTASYTNSLGDTAVLHFFVEIYDELAELTSYGTSLTLDQYVVYIDEKHPFAPVENIAAVKDNGIIYHVDTGTLYQFDEKNSAYRTVQEDENIHGMSQLVTEAARRGENGKWINYRFVDFTFDGDLSKPGTYIGTYTFASDMTGYTAKAMLQIVVR